MAHGYAALGRIGAALSRKRSALSIQPRALQVVAVSFSYKPTVQESALCGYDIFAHEKLAGLRGALRRGPRGHMPGGETVPILVMS